MIGRLKLRGALCPKGIAVFCALALAVNTNSATMSSA
jgi:hypothetical protein